MRCTMMLLPSCPEYISVPLYAGAAGQTSEISPTGSRGRQKAHGLSPWRGICCLLHGRQHPALPRRNHAHLHLGNHRRSPAYRHPETRQQPVLCAVDAGSGHQPLHCSGLGRGTLLSGRARLGRPPAYHHLQTPCPCRRCHHRRHLGGRACLPPEPAPLSVLARRRSQRPGRSGHGLGLYRHGDRPAFPPARFPAIGLRGRDRRQGSLAAPAGLADGCILRLRTPGPLRCLSSNQHRHRPDCCRCRNVRGSAPRPPSRR